MTTLLCPLPPPPPGSSSLLSILSTSSSRLCRLHYYAPLSVFRPSPPYHDGERAESGRRGHSVAVEAQRKQTIKLSCLAYTKTPPSESMDQCFGTI